MSDTDDAVEEKEETGGKDLDIKGALQAAYDDLGGSEDEDGEDEAPAPRAAKGEAAAPQEQISEAPEAPGIDAPHFWTSTDKQAFSKASREVQEAVHRYEAQRNQWASRLGNEVAAAKKRYADLDEAFAPLTPELERLDMAPASAVRRMVAWQKQIEADRVGGLRAFLATWGVSPEMLLGGEDVPQQAQQQYQMPPEYEEKFQALEQRLQSYEAERQERARGMLAQEIEFFRTETDEAGNVKRPYVDFFEPQIAAVVRHLKQLYPQAPNGQILGTAYDYVMEQANTSFLNPAREQVTQEIQQKTRRAKVAGASLPSSTSAVGTTKKTKGIRGALEQAWTDLS